MRILHVMPHYYPAVRYGGPIRSVHGLAAATAALGHEVYVYSTNVDGPGVSEVPIDIPVSCDGVSVSYFRAGVGRRVFRSPAMSRKLDETIGSFDIAHLHYVWVWSTVAAAAAARRHDVPYVLSPRGMLVADMIRRKNAFAKTMWLRMFDRQSVEAAAAIHVTAESEAAQLRALGLKPRRIEVVPNGINIPENVACDPTHAQIDRSPYVLFLGRISWKKGLDRLTSAMSLVPGIDLIMAGYDENGYQSKVERLAVQARVSERVHFVGPVEGEAKWALIRNALCLVLPSYNENFGMAVIEAMAVGCPVVVTEEVGLAEIVRASGSGLVTSGHPAELARAITTIAGSAQLRREISDAGRRTVRERFGWPTVAKQMQAIYQSLVPGKNGTV